MALRGERFELNLDPEDAYLGTSTDSNDHVPEQPRVSSAFDFVKDVLEREPAAPKPPEPPKLAQTATGFPAHKKRTGQSRFKQKMTGGGATVSGPTAKTEIPALASENKYLSSIADISADEKKSIDQQTTQMIENMSPEELAEAREELLSEPSIAIIQRLLKRSTIDDPPSDAFTRPPVTEPGPVGRPLQNKSSPVSAAPKKSVSFAEPTQKAHDSQISNSDIDDAPPNVPPSDLQPVTSNALFSDPANLLAPKQGQQKQTTTPEASKTPNLDPSSASFLSDLHSTYFPDLPNDPNQLAWMAPLPQGKETDGAQMQTQPADLRFDFRGGIVTKSQSEKIPVTKGLHHHGKDPGSAGYTINELAIYSRSTIAAQRCFAYQLLGRILYRLGKGDFGAEDSKQAKGLYEELKRGYILEQLLQEAARDPGTGSESARVWALEAVWLWRKGGGKGLDNMPVLEEEDVMGEAAGAILEEGLNSR